jgi:hypothetical protein
MHVYDYSFLKGRKVDSDIMGKVGSIGRIDASMDAPVILVETVRDAVELRAMMMSAADSDAVAGIPKGHNEEEIAGYRDAMRLICQEYESMDVGIDSILEIYSVLMGRNPDANLGFKTMDNAILERDLSGRIIKVHDVVPASEVEDNIRQLVRAFRKARDDADISNLLLIPCFMDDFLIIHPFEDGNGRMSLLLTTLLL